MNEDCPGSMLPAESIEWKWDDWGRVRGYGRCPVCGHIVSISNSNDCHRHKKREGHHGNQG